MNPTAIIQLPFRYKPWRPRHCRLILRDVVGGADGPEKDHETHLKAAVGWLCRAQDARDGQPDGGGVSAGWSFEDGWLPSYPETTGYIIETMIAAADVLGGSDLVDRANRMIDWELSIQREDGAFPGHFGEPGSRPVIFNTGQIMHGMIAGYLQLKRRECLDAAARAGHWLADQQDADGCFRRFEHNDVPHVYNTRGTWALLSTGIIAGDAVLVNAARKHLDWALSQQTPSGWFASNAFTPERAPFTHTIAYAIRGFLESGVLLGESRYLNAALKAAQAMAHAQRDDGWLAGTYGDHWEATSSFCCLTGVAQMCLNWIRLAQEGIGLDLVENAERGIAYLKRCQRLDDADDAVRGAVAGSYPIWGDYSRFEFPNWATKFYADALMMDMVKSPIPPVPVRGKQLERGLHAEPLHKERP